MIDDRIEAEDSGVIQLGVSLVGLPDEGLGTLKTLCSKQFREHAPFLDSWLLKALIGEVCRRANNTASDARPTLNLMPLEGGCMTLVLDGWDRKRVAEAVTELTKATYAAREHRVGEFLDGLCKYFVFENQWQANEDIRQRAKEEIKFLREVMAGDAMLVTDVIQQFNEAGMSCPIADVSESHEER